MTKGDGDGTSLGAFDVLVFDGVLGVRIWGVGLYVGVLGVARAEALKSVDVALRVPNGGAYATFDSRHSPSSQQLAET